MIDNKEYARQLRANAAKDENGVIRCSPELWEEIARIIENSEEVKQGKWIKIMDYGNGNCFGCCSVCGTRHKAQNATELKVYQRRCRWCGAKMDGRKDDK